MRRRNGGLRVGGCEFGMYFPFLSFVPYSSHTGLFFDIVYIYMFCLFRPLFASLLSLGLVILSLHACVSCNLQSPLYDNSLSRMGCIGRVYVYFTSS